MKESSNKEDALFVLREYHSYLNLFYGLFKIPLDEYADQLRDHTRYKWYYTKEKHIRLVGDNNGLEYSETYLSSCGKYILAYSDNQYDPASYDLLLNSNLVEKK